jgi:hypothetical protein
MFFNVFDFQGTFRTSNGPNIFATTFFWEIEYREKKKSMGNATRWKRGPTMRAMILAVWWSPSAPRGVPKDGPHHAASMWACMVAPLLVLVMFLVDFFFFTFLYFPKK